MIQTGDKFLSVLAAVLIVFAFVLKAVIPQTYRLALKAATIARIRLHLGRFWWRGLS